MNDHDAKQSSSSRSDPPLEMASEEEGTTAVVGGGGEMEGEVRFPPPEAAVAVCSSGVAPSSSPPRRRSFCCREMQLMEFRDRYFVRSSDPGAPDDAFSLSRADGELLPLDDAGDSSLGSPIKTSTIYGVVGTIRLLAGTYVLIITSREEMGNHLGFPVFLVKSMRFLCCNEALKYSTPQEKRDEAYFMTLLKTVELTPGLYYSYESDLTLNLQRTFNLAESRVYKPLWKQADPRFVWNWNLLEELIETKLHGFIIPLIQGSYQTIQFPFQNLPAQITLLSRRCNRRLGTRMWRRGANLAGDTANFIETEQLVEYHGFKSSFLQVRGSIPILWEQIVDLSYKPRLSVINHEETPKVVERHFHDLIQRYGETMAVDLTDKNGDEGQLSSAFAAEMEKLPHLRYVSFDFHQHCRKGNFDNLKLLYDQISEDVERQGYFLMDSEGEIICQQTGIIRSNCIDCLDRTNVLQSYLGKKSLNSQLQHMQAFSSGESISTYTDMYEMFKILWVEHGDIISLQYAGTHALKRDLVRYGRQTLGGLIKDGMSAISRYYFNNFQDGIRQDALDLISGRYTVSKNGPSPFQLNGFETISYLPMASALIVGGITLTTFTLNQANRNTQQLASTVLWAGLAAGVAALVRVNGKQLCSRPRLCRAL